MKRLDRMNMEECERAVVGLEGVERVENQLLVDQYHRFAP